MKFLALLLALLSCAYANKVAKEMVAALMEIHVSIRDNFTVLGRKLAPLKYSKDLERLAKQWVNTCQQSRPTHPKFAGLGSNVIAAPEFESVVRKWRDLMSSERQNYNLATGQCTAASCEHFMQVVQPRNAYFGCAVGYCVVWMQSSMPVNLSVCLYQVEDHGVSIQQGDGLSTTTYTTAPTATVKSATVMVKLGTRPEPPSSASISSSEAEYPVKYFADYFVKEKGEGEESNVEKEVEEEKEKEGEEKEDEKEREEKVSKLVTPIESTTAKVKSTERLGLPLLDIDEMEEADDEEEEEDDDDVENSSISAQLSSLLPSFAMIAIALLF